MKKVLLLTSSNNPLERQIPKNNHLTWGEYIFQIEIGEKPTYPIGELSVSWQGEPGKYEDLGVRKRALLALGAFDTANPNQLKPLDSGVKVLGCSSDHTIIDIHDSSEKYRLGGIVSFMPAYQPMLFATANSLIEKRYVE